mgnify:CR=1 FL=1
MPVGVIPWQFDASFPSPLSQLIYHKHNDLHIDSFEDNSDFVRSYKMPEIVGQSVSAFVSIDAPYEQY